MFKVTQRPEYLACHAVKRGLCRTLCVTASGIKMENHEWLPLEIACGVLKCPLIILQFVWVCSEAAISRKCWVMDFTPNEPVNFPLVLASPQCDRCSSLRCSTSMPQSRQLMRQRLWTRPANIRTATTKPSAASRSILWSRQRCSQNNCSLVGRFFFFFFYYYLLTGLIVPDLFSCNDWRLTFICFGAHNSVFLSSRCLPFPRPVRRPSTASPAGPRLCQAGSVLLQQQRNASWWTSQRQGHDQWLQRLIEWIQR